MIQDLFGQPDAIYARRAVGYADIPSDINKAYQSPYDAAGGIGAKLGGAFDPRLVAREETLTQDELPLGATNYKPYVSLAIGIGILFLILKVAR